MRTSRFTVLLTLLGLAVCGSSLAAGTPAGTAISNQASVTAIPTGLGAQPISSVSNIIFIFPDVKVGVSFVRKVRHFGLSMLNKWALSGSAKMINYSFTFVFRYLGFY